MHYARYPFIDLAVHAAIRERFAAGDALVVASPDLDTILWANGAAARLFGFTSIYEFIEDGIGAQSTVRRQIASAMTGIAQIGARDFLMRSASGFQRSAVNARVELIALPGGAAAVLVSVKPSTAARNNAARAQTVISGFDDTDTPVAVLDAGGSVLAASPSFARVAVSPSECARLVAEVTGEADRLVKRLVASGSGQIPAAIGRLTDDPALHLLFAVEPVAAEEPAEDLEATASMASTPAAVVDDTSLRSELAASMPPEAVPAAPAFATTQVDIAPDLPSAHDETDPLWANVPPQDLHPDMPEDELVMDADDGVAGADAFGPDDGMTDEDDAADLAALDGVEQDATAMHEPAMAAPETAAPEPVAPETAAPEIAALEAAQFQFDPQARPARFVWKIDRDGAFSEVSPEFGATVGPNAADIIGRKFADIAQVFNLDPDHIIVDLLHRRDTWSGKTVHWPVQGTDLVAPVDLAALPTYTRDRQFDGFRGFGIVRIGEVRQDPEALGLALVPGRPVPALVADGSVEAAGDGPGVRVDVPPLSSDELTTIAAEYDAIDETASALDESDDFSAFDASDDFDGDDAFEAGSEEDWQIAASHDDVSAGGDSEIAADPFRGERPALHIVATPGRRESDKVIDLGERRARTREGLSPLEQAAFREIGARLNATAAENDEPIDRTPANDVPAPVSAGLETPLALADADRDLGESGVDGHVEITALAEDDDIDAVLTAEEGSSGEEPVAEDISDVSGSSDAAAGELDSNEQEPDLAETEADEITAATEVDEPLCDADAAPEALVADDLAADDQMAIGGLDDLEVASGEPVEASDEPDLELEADNKTPSDEAADVPAPAEAAAEAQDASAPLPSAFALPPRQALPAGLSEDLVDAIPAALLVHAGERLIHANRDFLTLTGYASLEALAEDGGLDHLLDRPHDDEAGAGTITMRRADGSEAAVTARLRSINWRDGQALLLALSPAVKPESAGVATPAAASLALAQMTPQPDQPGRTAAMDEASVRRLGALEVEAAELRSILETATDGVVILGADGVIRSMNGSACALFGYDEAETRGKPFAMLFAHESQRAVIDYFGGLAEHGVSSVLNDGREVIGREANGGFLPLFMTMGRLSGSNGFCAVLRDITQWKRSEEELRNAKRAAETASSHKSEFLARVSHEIRTPLNAIIGFSEMMVEERFGPIGSPRYLEYAHDIGNSGKHVLDIVNDLLDISKIEAGEVDLDFAAVSLNDQLAECVSMLQPMANGQRVIIRTSLSVSVPEVVADGRSVKQIALNLLSNAIRYTPSGGQIVVSTSYETSGNVVLKIRDTGIGMTRKELEQAMKPFGQVGPGPRQRGDGTGLGLPLTKAMVEANRAQFDIVSTPAEGTLVTITFPPQRVLAD